VEEAAANACQAPGDGRDKPSSFFRVMLIAGDAEDRPLVVSEWASPLAQAPPAERTMGLTG
jgi:hypothetical protein